MLFRPGIRLFCFFEVFGILRQPVQLDAEHSRRCIGTSMFRFLLLFTPKDATIYLVAPSTVDILIQCNGFFQRCKACESVGNNRNSPVQSRCYRHNNVRAARTWWGMTDNRPASDCYPNTAPFPVEFFSRESFCTSCFRSLCIKPHNPTSSRNTAIEKKPSAFRSAAFRPPDKYFLVGIDRIRFC